METLIPAILLLDRPLNRPFASWRCLSQIWRDLNNILRQIQQRSRKVPQIGCWISRRPPNLSTHPQPHNPRGAGIEGESVKWPDLAGHLTECSVAQHFTRVPDDTDPNLVSSPSSQSERSLAEQEAAGISPSEHRCFRPTAKKCLATCFMSLQG